MDNHSSKKRKQKKLKNTKDKTEYTLSKPNDGTENVLSKPYVHSIDSIKSSKDLTTFIQVECSIKNNNKRCSKFMPVFKNIDKIQCSIIKKYIDQQIKVIKKFEESANTKHQRLLLKKVRKYIKKCVDD